MTVHDSYHVLDSTGVTVVYATESLALQALSSGAHKMPAVLIHSVDSQSVVAHFGLDPAVSLPPAPDKPIPTKRATQNRILVSADGVI